MNDEIILKVFYQLKKKYFTNLTFQFNLKDVIRERWSIIFRFTEKL